MGKKRRLLVNEIASIFANLRNNIIGGALITGFGQTSKSEKLKKYFFRGRDLSWKIVEDLTSIYMKENIPIPSTSDSFVTDTTTAPFSEKLMLFHIVTLNGSAVGQMGLTLANVMRHDLQTKFSGSIIEVAKYIEDGLDMMVENGWMEQPPQVMEHKELVKA